MNVRMWMRGMSVVIVAAATLTSQAQTINTAFTYQGQLKQNGTPVNETCDFAFTLWRDTGGFSISVATLLFDGQAGNGNPIPVDNGLFSVGLDFGAEVFNGDPLLLEVAVRCPTGAPGAMTALSPLQRITAAPYSVRTRGILVDEAGHVSIGPPNPALQTTTAGNPPPPVLAVDGDSDFTGDVDIAGDVDVAGTVRLHAPLAAGTTAGTPPGMELIQNMIRSTDGDLEVNHDNVRGTHINNTLHVQTDGNVGIGTTSPEAALDVVGQVRTSGTGAAMRVANPNNPLANVLLNWLNDVPRIRIGGNGAGASNGFDIQSVGDRSLLRVLNNGNVGIGTDTPTSRLHLRNNEPEIALRMKASGSWTAELKQTDSSFLSLVNGGSERLTIAPGGNVGIGTTAPAAGLQLSKIGQWKWTVGNGWGDLSLSDGNVGFSIGVATGGGGTGDVRMWTTGGTERLMIGNPTDGETVTVDNGNVGIGTISPGARLNVVGGTDADPSGNGGFIIAGTINAQNIAIDDNEIAARNNGALTRLTLNADGGEVVVTGQAADRVGIGTVNPQVKLDVRGTGDDAGGVSNVNEVVARFRDTSSTGHTAVSIDAGSGQDAILYFAEGGGAAWGFRADAEEKLWAEGQFELRYHRGNNNIPVNQIVAATDHSQFTMYHRGPVVPWEDAAFNLGASSSAFFGGRWKDVWAANAFIQTSDRREKKNIRDLSAGLTEVLRLRPVSFQWDRKNDDGRTRFGLIAQEVNEVIPDAVVKNDDPNVLWGMSYATLVPVLIKAAQEQQAQIDRQSKRIMDLESRLRRIEATMDRATSAPTHRFGQSKTTSGR